jgi:hypothetical protein
VTQGVDQIYERTVRLHREIELRASSQHGKVQEQPGELEEWLEEPGEPYASVDDFSKTGV